MRTLVVKKDVVKLEIAMRNTSLVRIRDTVHNLGEKVARLIRNVRERHQAQRKYHT